MYGRAGFELSNRVMSPLAWESPPRLQKSHFSSSAPVEVCFWDFVMSLLRPGFIFRRPSTQYRITDSIWDIKPCSGLARKLFFLRDFRTTVSRNSRSVGHFSMIRSISWLPVSYFPQQMFFNTKTFSDTTCAIVSGKIMINYNQSGFERIFWFAIKLH